MEGAAARRVGASVGERTRICERGFRVRIFSSSHLPFFSSLPSTSKRFHAFGGPFADFTIPHNAIINSESRLLSR